MIGKITNLGPGDPETWGSALHAQLDADEQWEKRSDMASAEANRIAESYRDEWPSPGDKFYCAWKQSLISILEDADEDQLVQWLRGWEVSDELKDLIQEEFETIVHGLLMQEYGLDDS